jgi:short-subunit dehydrogenase involved in D-alanine esterification of teichoic acids
MSPSFDLTGEKILVTGGSRGLGRAMAEGFARAGAGVMIASRKQDACDAAAAGIVGAALYPASDASFRTGAVIKVDGGSALTPG